MQGITGQACIASKTLRGGADSGMSVGFQTTNIWSTTAVIFWVAHCAAFREPSMLVAALATLDLPLRQQLIRTFLTPELHRPMKRCLDSSGAGIDFPIARQTNGLSSTSIWAERLSLHAFADPCLIRSKGGEPLSTQAYKCPGDSLGATSHRA